jgi:hypothetical protein
MNNILISIEDTVATMLSPLTVEEVTRDLIEKSVLKIAEFHNIDSKQDIEDIVRRLEARFDVTMSLGTVFFSDEYRPWLENARSDINWYYFERYKRYLLQQRFPPQVIRSMDDITDQILDQLEDPGKDGNWDRRGMVVGYVQSGKTANYIGLINKAADAGYKVIIVLAGLLNILRNQTQIRIDTGFIGVDTDRRVDIGVGILDPERKPAYFTTSRGDFNKNIANQLGVGLGTLNEPVVFVIKKNKKTFENLINWLQTQNRHDLQDYPMLLIDDEADHASINTNREDVDPTTINKKIRKLLNLFVKSSYVGYTATPFANVFIDPDNDDEMLGNDLFPKDFIISLDPPSNYFGPERIFSKNGEQGIIRQITDHGDIIPLRHKIDLEVDDLPESLKYAIKTFILVRIIRYLRGDIDAHNSMMINVSRFTRVQTIVKRLCQEYLSTLEATINNNYRLPTIAALQNPHISEIKNIFEVEFPHVEITWGTIQEKLKEGISRIGVIEVNSSSTSERLYYDRIDFPNGRNVIAIGGLSLSRGLTLEGLSVSYFLRNSIMYDTLMQMGRWFGYRDGYDDLCRVFMTPEAENWYAHISNAMDELRSEFKRMKLAGMTPKEFGLCVRSHPESLIVTARNKMRSATPVLRQINLAGSLIETSVLVNSPDVIKQNMNQLEKLISNLDACYPFVMHESPYGFYWSNIPVDYILLFIEGFINHPASIKTTPSPVIDYITKLRMQGIDRWDIFFPSLLNSDYPVPIDSIKINRPSRSVSYFHDSGIEFNQRRVGDATFESAGLDPSERIRIEKEFLESENKKGIPGSVYRRYRGENYLNPLFIPYLLNCTINKESISDTGLVAYGISFPGESGSYRADQLVEYVVNTVWWQTEFLYLLDDAEVIDE